jgi:serine O-acetyltransferase
LSTLPADGYPDHSFAEELLAHGRVAPVPVPSPQRVAGFLDALVGLLFAELSEAAETTGEKIAARLTLLRYELTDLLTLLQPAATAEGTAAQLWARLPVIYRLMRLDAEALLAEDPAATNLEEVIAAYPGFRAIAIHRISHELQRSEVLLLPRLMSELAHARTGIDIHPGASIGKSCSIDHGTGVVIGETAVIGDHVKIFQGVTLGALHAAKSSRGVKRHPTIEDRVVLYANATVLGDAVIGHDTVIGGNVWLTTSVAPNSFVYHTAQVRVRQLADLLEPSDYSI